MRLVKAVEPRHVKAEAERRILTVWPLWRQMNALRDGGDDLVRMGNEIDAIRAASNVLEAMQPIPADFDHERHWS